MNRMGRIIFLLLALLPTQVGAEDAKAQPKSDREGILNKLLSPGKLIEGHKDLESVDCLRCHNAGKGVPSELCLDCHKDLRPYVSEKRGFHGRADKQCHQCHSDHKGRDFDSTKINENEFDHTKTGYKLEGKHSKIQCSECHTAKRKDKPIRPEGVRYFGAQSTCDSCHSKDNPHHFSGDWAKKDCQSCHGLKAWTADLKFDHEKDAKYLLEGKHTKIKCDDCHKLKSGDYKYTWPNLKIDRCKTCHEDVHKNQPGEKFKSGNCLACHTQQSWRVGKFDHQKQTRFALNGAHAKIKCNDCHKLKSGEMKYTWANLETDKCRTCHEDPHQDRLSEKFRGGACSTCHGELRWKIEKFEHETVTQYPLKGAHAKVDCVKCHVQTAEVSIKESKKRSWVGLKTECAACHKDVHQFGEFKGDRIQNLQKCETCHTELAWKTTHDFDHSKSTRYSIDGKHKSLECKQCHTPQQAGGSTSQYQWPDLDVKTCEACHKSPHRGQFSERGHSIKCSGCHVTESWKRPPTKAEFDHDANTRFKITGKHNELTCEKCHGNKEKQKYLFEEVSALDFCVGCHESVHKGQFSDKFIAAPCSNCHDTNDWEHRSRFDHDQSRFHLRGKHAEVKCEKCHPLTSAVFSTGRKERKSKFLFSHTDESRCVDCHKDPHRGNYGDSCSECHNENNFKQVPDFHRNFSLRGIHYSLQCQECHTTDRRLSGMSQNCVLCHQKDDAHQGSLPKCADCHIQTFWELNGFRHSLSSFPLRGIHRTLECVDCHSEGVYRGLASNCNGCHAADAASVSTPSHVGAAFLDCSRSGCHNQFTFER